jgi:streptogramin lyase
VDGRDVCRSGRSHHASGSGHRVRRSTRAGYPSNPDTLVPRLGTQLMFSDSGGSQIDSIDSATGAIRERPVKRGVRPVGLAVGPDGAIWFCEDVADAIGRVRY